MARRSLWWWWISEPKKPEVVDDSTFEAFLDSERGQQLIERHDRGQMVSAFRVRAAFEAWRTEAAA